MLRQSSKGLVSEQSQLELGLRLSRGLQRERSGLWTRIGTTGSVSLCVRDEKLTVFLELQRAIHARSR